MAVKPKDVKDIALSGEFDDYKSSALQLYITMAEGCVNASVWGDKAEDAIKLLAAHFITVASREGASGAITSEKVGDLQTNYSQSSDNDDELSTSGYGQMFLQMRKGLVITPRLACQR